MAHYSFRKDVKEGELGEKFVTKCLCETYGATLLSENKTNNVVVNHLVSVLHKQMYSSPILKI